MIQPTWPSFFTSLTTEETGTRRPLFVALNAREGNRAIRIARPAIRGQRRQELLHTHSARVDHLTSLVEDNASDDRIATVRGRIGAAIAVATHGCAPQMP